MRSNTWRNQLALLLALILFALARASYPLNSSTSEMLEIAAPIPLWCFDSKTDYFWESELLVGCGAEGQSLGAERIQPASVEVTELNALVNVRFLAAQSQARIEGINLQITSGFRTLARQKYLFAKAIKKYGSAEEASKWVLPPAKSHHPQGIALDVNYPSDLSTAKWLEVNGYRYGLCRVYENEWWHFEPVIAPGEACPALVANALFEVN